MARIRQSSRFAGLGFKIKVLKTCHSVTSSLRTCEEDRLDLDIIFGVVHHQPSEGGRTAFFNCPDLYLKSPDSGERQYKSRTWKRRFGPWWYGTCEVGGLDLAGILEGIRFRAKRENN